MTHSQLTAHPLYQAVEIAAACQVGQEYGIPGFQGIPVGSVHTRVVEIVAVYAPGFVKDLSPFCCGVNLHLDILDIQLAFAGLGLLTGRGNATGSLMVIQHFGAIGRKDKIAHFHHFAVLTFLQVVFMQHGSAGIGIRPGDIKYFIFLAACEVIIVTPFDRESDYPVLQAFKIDGKRRRCFHGYD